MLRFARTTNLLLNPTLLCLALLPTYAGAQCTTGWDANGVHVIRQEGQQFAIQVTLQHKGRVITGNAMHVVNTRSGGTAINEGTVDGTLDGDSFNVQIFWTSRQTGVYTAKILPSGRLDGVGYEKNTPTVRPAWHTEGVLKCAQPAAPAPKPLRATGKARTEATPQPKPPFITAGQIPLQPILPYASFTLAWDGGPDYPNVEVWVSVNNGADVPAFSMDFPQQHPIFKQPKAGFELKLARGSGIYKYSLKAAGKILSTVTVVAQ